VAVEEAVPLWDGVPPGSEDWKRQERELRIPAPVNATMLQNVVCPTLTPVLPDPSVATGTGVLVCPGGGYFMLAISHEGFDVAQWLAGRGIAAFVLKYRVMETPADDDEMMTFLAQSTDAANGLTGLLGRMDDFASIPLADGLAALKVVRDRAAEWGIRDDRVGALGFSAGARLTVDLATDDVGQAALAFVGAIYGTGCARPVPTGAPPLFAAVAADDPLFDRSLQTLAAWRRSGRPAEAHLYGRGGHGFGMREQGLPCDGWIELLRRWMVSEGFVGPA
jgi:acetyl esterase/lipase